MLVLTRKLKEKILIGNDITVTVFRLARGAVRLGIDAPKQTPIIRAELIDKEGENGQVRDSN